MLSRRSFLKKLHSPLLIVGAFSASKADAATSTNALTVGIGGDFSNVSDALDSITDNSRDKPYIVQVLPGVYDLKWNAKSWVTIRGSGPLATIFEGRNWGGIKIPESNVHLTNFGVRYNGSDNPYQAAIKRSGPASGVYLSEIDIEHVGGAAAIKNVGGDPKNTWWLRNIKIRTEGIGLDISGETYCDDMKILLHGSYSGHPHTGCRVTQYARVYLNNCRIGTGYWFDKEESGGYIGNTVYGDDDVIGIWVVSDGSDINPRIEAHGLESFCRNENTRNPSVNVNVIRVETGWLRAFGCFGQAETPADWGIRRTLYQSGSGKIEQYGCRFTGIEGASYGSNTMGVQTFTTNDDGYTFDKFEGGLHRLDATNGDFTLILQWQRYIMPGVQHIFKKVDSTYAVTIDLNGALLEGSSINPVLTDQYDELKIAWDGTEWITI